MTSHARRATCHAPKAPAGATRWRTLTPLPPDPGADLLADHVQGGGSFPRAVGLAGKVLEDARKVNRKSFNEPHGSLAGEERHTTRILRKLEL